MNTKPFNLEQAKAGAPVALSTGRRPTPVRILATDITGSHSVAFTYEGPHCGLVGTATSDGLCVWTSDNRIGRHLYMIPHGQLDGRDVWPGDVLFKNGNPINVGCEFTMGDSGYSWPKQYPTVQWNSHEVYQALAVARTPGGTDAGMAVNVANAAIKHGILNGYLYAASEINDPMAELITALGMKQGTFAAVMQAAIKALEPGTVAQAHAKMLADAMGLPYGDNATEMVNIAVERLHTDAVKIAGTNGVLSKLLKKGIIANSTLPEVNEVLVRLSELLERP